MASLNKVILVGNLGRDPEVRHLENGASVAKFSLATTESYKDKSDQWQQQTEWHDIVAWRYLAERAEQLFKKGSFVYVEGKLTHRKWVDKEGNNRLSTEIVAQSLRLLERREGGGSNYSGAGSFPSTSDEISTSNNPNPAAPKPASTPTPVAAAPQEEAVVEEPADDLPF